MELANRIRKIRETKGLTQTEVAGEINISPSAYGQIERKAANSSYLTLCKVADALRVSIHFLLDIKSKQFIEQKNKL
ncbi:MAG: helix-turn-helix transcriptional regulator [Bacteroidota bacterium]